MPTITHIVDLGSGTGQASIPLATLSSSVEHVYGIEPSDVMRKAAVKHDKITYIKGSAETFLESVPSKYAGKVQLLTVAQAAHWFHMPSFFANAHSLLSPNKGTLAYWGYSFFTVPSIPEVGRLVEELGTVTLSEYWDVRRKLLDDLYTHPSFEPPEELFQNITRVVSSSDEFPEPFMQMDLSLNQIDQYLRTWSAYSTFLAMHSEHSIKPRDPVDEIMKVIATIAKKVMNLPAEKCLLRVQWPVVLIMATAK